MSVWCISGYQIREIPLKKRKKKKTVHSIKMLPIRSNFLGEILFIKTIIQDPSAYVKTSE